MNSTNIRCSLNWIRKSLPTNPRHCPGTFARRMLLLAAFVGLWLTALPTAQAGPLPQPGVYRWAAPNGPANVDAYGAWVGRNDVWGQDFLAGNDWTQVSGPNWILNPWSTWVGAKEGRRLILGVPMLPNLSGVSLETGATGAYNTYYQTLAQNLVAKGLDNSIIRLGWEFNGGWYKWAANGKTAAFVSYWQQIVTTMRAVPGAQNLQFCWNPARGYLQFPAEQAYPGDSYVDSVALDVYDESWLANTYPWPAGSSAAEIESRRQTVWTNDILNGNHGIAFWQSFAATHNKPFAFGEWGITKRADTHGGEDNAAFIQNMYDYMTTHPVAWAVYFDVQAADGEHQLSTPTPSGTTDFPLSRAKFLQLFGGGTTYEAETLARTATNSVTIFSDTVASGGQALRLNSSAIGQYIIFTVPVASAGTYTVKTKFKGFTSRGKCQLMANGSNLGAEQDLYNAGTWFESDLGNVSFATSGDKYFTFTVTGKNPGSTGYDLAFDYIKLVPVPPIVHEVEGIATAVSSDSITLVTDASASGGQAERLNSNAVNDYATYTVPLAQAGTYTIKVRVKRHTSRGKFQLAIDGSNQGSVQDLYSTLANDYVELNLGSKTFSSAGDKNFTFTVTGKNAGSSGYDLMLDSITLTP